MALELEPRGMGQVPLLKRKSDLVCPKCGQRPKLADNGEPEAMRLEVASGFATYHCLPCAGALKAALEQLLGFCAPTLVKAPLPENSN